MPTIPEYQATGAQDVTAIAGVHLPTLFFTKIQVIESVPVCYRESWAKANTQVFQWIKSATPGSIHHDCALMWELLLHRLLLRKSPKSRGRQRDNDTLSSRFQAFLRGDYQSLVTGLQRACEKAARRQQEPEAPQKEEETIKKVQKLLAKGLFSKAYRILDSEGRASMLDKGVVAQLDAKHLKRDYELPGHLPQNLPSPVTINPNSLRRVYRELKPLAGTGPCGFRNEYLQCLAADMLDPSAKLAVEEHAHFASLYVNAVLPKWYYYIASATAMMALIKKHAAEPGGTPDVRPIGMGGCKRRAWISLLIQDNADTFRRSFWPVQVAVGVKAGVAKLIFALTEHMKAHPDHTLLKLDFTNAFNSVWRSAILSECLGNEAWRHLYRFFWCNLSPRSRILAINALSEEGVQQGDPSGPAGFCIALHRHAVWAHQQLQEVGGMAIFDMDDGYMAGPLDKLMEVVEGFQARLKKYVGAELNPSKCELWCANNSVVESYLQQHPECQFKVGSVVKPDGAGALGVMISGVPFGDADYVQHVMKKKVDVVVSQIKSTTSRLQHVCVQNLYALLVQCLNTKIQFWLQCMRPAQLRRHLHRLDKEILESARVATGMKFDRGSLSLKRLRWPKRLFGGMIRSAADVHAAAYLGGICLCVPSFTAWTDKDGVRYKGLLDHMDTAFGQGSFHAGQEESRFETLLGSGTTLGNDLRDIFDQLREEVHGTMELEDIPNDSPFKAGAAGLGTILGEVKKRPQHEFTVAREWERANSAWKQLSIKLSRRGSKPNRQEAAFLSANKLNMQFVGVPSMFGTAMDTALFREAWACYLGEASPACSHWIGWTFKPSRGKRRSVDMYGDNVARSHVRGDGWRTRHDAFKWAIIQLADWCQYKLHVEPANMFLPFIRQRDDFMAKRARKRQGLIPDLFDVQRNVMMDVKGFSWGDHYRPIRFYKARRCRAVERRSEAVDGEYRKKAVKIDREYNDWQGTGPGPVEHHLIQYGVVEGLAIGAHGEGSDTLMALVDRMAERGATRRYRDLGYGSAKSAWPMIKQHILMRLGVEAIRGCARLKLTNLASILAGGESTKAQAARRSCARQKYSSKEDFYWSAHCRFER